VKFATIRENKPKSSAFSPRENTPRHSDNRPKDNDLFNEPKSKKQSKDQAQSTKIRFYDKWFHAEWLQKWDIKKVRGVAGTFVMLSALFLLVALASHLFYYGSLDQSAVESLSEQNAKNNGGYFGAVFGQYLITDGFGLVSLILPFYLFLIGYAISENKFWDVVKKLFPYTLFGLYWTSTTLAYLKIVFELPFTDLGGGVGLSLNEWIGWYIGKFGMGLFLVFVLLLFVNYKIKSHVGIFGFVGSLLARYDRKEQQPHAQPFSRKMQEEQVPNGSITNTPNNSPIPDEKDDVDDGFIISVRKVPKEDVTEEQEIINESTDSHLEHNNPDFQAIADEMELIGVNPTPNTTSAHPEVEFIIEEPKHEPVSFQADTNTVSTVFELQTPSVKDQPLFFIPDDNWEPATFDLQTDPGGIQFLLPEQTLDFEFTVPKIEKRQQVIDNEDIELIIAPTDLDLPMPVMELLDTETGETTFISKTQQPYDPTKDLSLFQFPSIELLENYEERQQRGINREELEANKDQIVRTLSNYGIEIVSIKATIGPTVTLYEIVPAAGVRISKIKNLEDDIALSLAALGIRIIAPMPGKGTIGIEIPNSKPEMVSFRNVVSTEKFQNSQAILPIALGRTISNEVYVFDLAKMPHLLVAGATGQGKSVGLNTIIASILYKKHPGQVKFVLIDPKKVEMSLYQALEYHYLAKLPNLDDAIITDNKDVIHVLNSLCKEMDDRYKLLQDARVRHIEEYNAKFIDRKLNPENGHKYLPYIILIIDELADLMFTAGKEIEMPIARLAQLARAIGIHLVVATQRPSVNVITGLIKANFPARMSYRVTQKIDSRTILDANGAEQLIGRGDLLLMKDGDLVRVQNAFIDTSEVERVVEHISKQQRYPQPYYLPDVSDGEDQDGHGGGDLADRDPLFEESARLLVSLNSGSTSSIQQHLKIGYNRAARIMLQLEKAGIVSTPAGGNKPREILVKNLYDLEHYL
jgi:S-DNA-T family DNA segregation ATPase FtsK/SpoIIIE